MVWKILSALSIVCLATACGFAWLNQQDLKVEKDREKVAQANFEAANKRKTEGDAALKEKQNQYVTIQKDLDTLKQDSDKLAAEAAEKEAAVGVIKGLLEQKTQQVMSVDKQITDLGDVEKLLAAIDKLKKDQLAAQQKEADQVQRLDNAKKGVEVVTKEIAGLRDAEVRGRRGIVDPDFNARISQYFPEWDFAILNKGNNSGVFANADLEVKRGRNVIARLKVRNVEQHLSIADLVPGSLAKGDGIRPGDVVVASATQSAAQPAPSPAAKAGATPPGTPAAPGAAPAAPGAPAMNSDPFAAPAAPGAPAAAPGAAPAPAAAPAMSDPFGAPPAAPAAPGAAPAAPAKPAADDPFGAAPKK